MLHQAAVEASSIAGYNGRSMAGGGNASRAAEDSAHKDTERGLRTQKVSGALSGFGLRPSV